MPILFITSAFRGFCTPSDLLREYAGFEFRIRSNPTEDEGLFFVLDNDFLFSLHCHDSGLELRRNEYKVFLPTSTEKDLSHLPVDWTYPEIKVHWNANELILSCRIGHEIREERTPTSPTMPPTSLRRWAKKPIMTEQHAEVDLYLGTPTAAA